MKMTKMKHARHRPARRAAARAPRHDHAALVRRASVNEGGRIAGYENEYFGGVGEPVVADGNPVHDVLRNVVEKDQPQREAAKQVESQVASGRSDRRHEFLLLARCQNTRP